MYTEFFHFKETPFALEPDSRFLVMVDEHKEALATLIYAIEQREGWALLLGDAGIGKTTLIMALLKELGEAVVPAVITNPLLDPLDFFNMIALELGMDGPFASKGQFLIALGQLINRCRQERKILLLVIDEAHSLTPRLLEELRLLGNLDGSSPRVLNIFLVGQPKVLLLMKKAGARGLMQRLHRHYLLKPLSQAQVAEYVRHRLEVAGGAPEIFDDGAIQEIQRIAGGIPRLINALCDEALILAYSKNERRIDGELVRQAGQSNKALRWSTSDDGIADSFGQSTAEDICRQEPPRNEAATPLRDMPLDRTPPEQVSTRLDELPPPMPDKPSDLAGREPAAILGSAPPAAHADGLDLKASSSETQAEPAAKPAKGPKPGLGSRFAASMSKTRPGSLWRRLVFLIIVLLLVAAVYVFTSQDGLRQAKRWWWILKGRPGPELFMPDAGRQPERKAAPQPDKPASEKDWGPSVPSSPPAENAKPQGGSNG